MLNAGTSLGDRYVLRELVARGGMGEVWRADDTVLGRVVAVKVLLPSLSGDPGFVQRFHTEARAMAAVSHPNIVEVYDYGEAFGLAYLVMQFVSGEPLHAVLRRTGPLPPHQAMTLVAQAAEALHHAHEHGIVHRDVKPGNLLLRPDGRLVLTDFGIARIVNADALTATGEVLGTASYLAPEQVNGWPVGPAADVYALGVVAYQCLTGTPPFVGATPVAVALMHTRDTPPPLPAAVPEAVRHVVMRAMAKDPRQRWASAAEMAAAASAAATGPRPVAPDRHVMSTPPLMPSGPRASTPRVPAPRSRPPAPAVPYPGPGGHGANVRRGRRGRMAGAAGLVLLLLAVIGWIALHRGTGGAARATPPTTSPTSAAGTSTGQPTTTPTSTPTPTATPHPTRPAVGPPATTTPASPKTTTPSTPGPNQRVVPDLTNRYPTEADYMVRAAGLVPDFVYITVANKCWVVDQTPAPNTIVAANSTVKATVAEDNPNCEPV